MKTVLLPTDFSNNSINAINYAVKLLKDVECDFYMLNVQKASSFISDDLISVSSSATIYQTIVDTAKRSIENLITSLQTKYKNDKHRFHSVVDYDNFVDSINQQCELYDIDLIIMGTKGTSGLERIIFGSNSMRVIQRCETPVLVIPDNYKFKNIDKIAFLSDYIVSYKENDLGALIAIAKLFNAKIEVLHLVGEDHLSEIQERNRAFVDQCFEKISHEFVDLNGNNLYETVQTYSANNKVKLLAMINKRHAFLERLFTKHNVESFGYHLSTPFLVMEHCAC